MYSARHFNNRTYSRELLHHPLQQKKESFTNIWETAVRWEKKGGGGGELFENIRMVVITKGGFE